MCVTATAKRRRKQARLEARSKKFANRSKIKLRDIVTLKKKK